MKVVVLATDSQSTWLLVNELRKDYPDLKIALEKPISRIALIKRRIRRIGLRKVAGQVLFMAYLPILRFSSRVRNKQLIAVAGLKGKRPPDLVAQQFDSVNSEACIAWLVSEQPDAVVVNGTRIISKDVLNSCKAVFLNTHCGITPAYRGVHGGYWALHHGDIDNIGVTIHQVDPGIDTGEIVYQEVIAIDEQDNFLTYPVKQYIVGIPLMRRALRDVETGQLSKIFRNDLPSAVWLHPTLWQYWGTRWQKGVR